MPNKLHRMIPLVLMLLLDSKMAITLLLTNKTLKYYLANIKLIDIAFWNHSNLKHLKIWIYFRIRARTFCLLIRNN